ncbi:MAG TPA: type II toxin-antitoxin system Phd/YefM family antitoxin [Gemmataceae bacterium]|nr:type II toxin-antitoxin system Phd/YefM family antitoxin [Gemmataceae bacterium]
MKAATVTEIGADFVGYLKASKKGPLVVTRKGKPVAVLLHTADADDLERLLMGHSPKLQAILEAARRRFRAGEGIPHETFWKQVEAENAGRGKKEKQSRKNGRNAT